LKVIPELRHCRHNPLKTLIVARWLSESVGFGSTGITGYTGLLVGIKKATHQVALSSLLKERLIPTYDFVALFLKAVLYESFIGW
jgi:hypothetical protein